MIVFASEANGGSISDKKITLDFGYLDKGFNMKKQCSARFIDVHVPSGNRGQSQMLPKYIKNTNILCVYIYIYIYIYIYVYTLHLYTALLYDSIY